VKRVVAIINKWWECDGVLSPLFSRDSRAGRDLPWPAPEDLHHPRKRTNPATPEEPAAGILPRVTLRLSELVAEFWCISDLLEHLPDVPSFQSSSLQKFQRLPAIEAAGAAPDCVIAVGTATLPDAALTENGSVVVGTQSFLFNAFPDPPNPHSRGPMGPSDKCCPRHWILSCSFM
jgi:hypothetical protein